MHQLESIQMRPFLAIIVLALAACAQDRHAAQYVDPNPPTIAFDESSDGSGGDAGGYDGNSN